MQKIFQVEDVDSIIVRVKPDLGWVIRELAIVRDVARNARLAEAHLMSYGMGLLGLDEFDETPALLLPAPEIDDD